MIENPAFCKILISKPDSLKKFCFKTWFFQKFFASMSCFLKSIKTAFWRFYRKKIKSKRDLWLQVFLHNLIFRTFSTQNLISFENIESKLDTLWTFDEKSDMSWRNSLKTQHGVFFQNPIVISFVLQLLAEWSLSRCTSGTKQKQQWILKNWMSVRHVFAFG